MVEELKSQISGMANALWANSAWDKSKEGQDLRTEQVNSLTKKISDITEYIYDGTGPMSDDNSKDDGAFDSPFFKNSVNKTKGSDKINYNTSFGGMTTIDVED